MVKKLRMWVVLAAILSGFVGVVNADEIADVRRQMEQQYEQMRQIQSKLFELEAAQKQQEASVQKMRESGGAMELPDSIAWIENIKLYGDFRYRHEQIDGDGVNQRDRHRVRARVGLKGKINDEWNFDLRLASGDGDSPISTNQDLDDGFSSKDVWLDRAFLTYKPQSIDGLSVLAGKMGNPFYSVGKNQLIWDGDLNPEGIAFKHNMQVNDSTTLFVNGGGMWVEERSSDTDTSLWGFQSGLKHAFENKDALTWGASYYKYGNIKGKSAIGSFAGNTSDGGVYAYDYELLEGFGEYATRLGDVPASVYGNYVVNTASGVNEDTGWLIGATYNKASNPGDWQVGYEYRDLERDAVLGAFSDSDFIGGGTDGKGHKFSFKYALAKNVAAGATYFLNDRDGDGDGQRDDTYRRLQLDVEMKF